MLRYFVALIAISIGIAAQAQNYPTKPIRMVVPFAVGGTSDILARIIGVKLSEALGESLVIENRPGAGGNIGAEIVARGDGRQHDPRRRGRWFPR